MPKHLTSCPRHTPHFLAAAALFLTRAGCKSGHSTSGAGTEGSGQARGASAMHAGRVTIDGDISEWPTDEVAFADEHFLYLRFSFGSEMMTIQSGPRTVSILID